MRKTRNLGYSFGVYEDDERGTEVGKVTKYLGRSAWFLPC
jgi:hypothetical protein